MRKVFFLSTNDEEDRDFYPYICLLVNRLSRIKIQHLWSSIHHLREGIRTASNRTKEWETILLCCARCQIPLIPSQLAFSDDAQPKWRYQSRIVCRLHRYPTKHFQLRHSVVWSEKVRCLKKKTTNDLPLISRCAMGGRC